MLLLTIPFDTTLIRFKRTKVYVGSEVSSNLDNVLPMSLSHDTYEAWGVFWVPGSAKPRDPELLYELTALGDHKHFDLPQSIAEKIEDRLILICKAIYRPVAGIFHIGTLGVPEEV